MTNCDVYNSKKSGKWVKFNSEFELRRMREIDNDESVIEWERNHVKYSFENHLWEPALSIKKTDGLYVEDIISDVPNPERIKFATEFYQNLGIKYRVISFGVNEIHRQNYQKDEAFDARIQSFELAFKMQTEATEVFDISRESESVRTMYGNTPQGKQMLIARRLVE